jgi:putative hydrolases of HD superfamily
MDQSRFDRQLRFVEEIDKLKQVFRQTYLLDGSRKENSAEHSWHLAVYALVFSEYARAEHLDVARVLQMALVHDIVEVDAGDTYCYTDAPAAERQAREQRAADRLFGLLPSDQAAQFLHLWQEFEARATPEARFLAGLDRLQPLVHNYLTEGRSWHEHGVGRAAVIERNRHLADGAPALWAFAERLINDAVTRGYLAP